MSDAETDSEIDTRNSQGNRLLCGLLILLCCFLLFLIGAVVAGLYVKGYFGGEEEQSVPKIRFSMLSEYERTDTSFPDIIDICNTKQRKLPTPKNEKQERTLIEDVKKFHEIVQCDSYLIGYKLDSTVRYRSKNGKTTWPPLRTSLAVAIPDSNRDCALIKLKSEKEMFEFKSSEPCDHIQEYNCVVGYSLEYDFCEFRRLQCLYAVDVFGTTPQEMFQSYKQMVVKHSEHSRPYGILLIDSENPPKDLTNLSFPSSDVCYALDVKYVLEYRDIYFENRAPYRINAILNDPEMECLIISSDNFKLETAHCNKSACALCEEKE